MCILLSRLSLGSSRRQFGSSDRQQIRVAFWFGLGVQNQIPLLSEHTYTASKDDSDSEEYTECSFKAGNRLMEEKLQVFPQTVEGFKPATFRPSG